MEFYTSKNQCYLDKLNEMNFEINGVLVYLTNYENGYIGFEFWYDGEGKEHLGIAWYRKNTEEIRYKHFGDKIPKKHIETVAKIRKFYKENKKEAN